ncbi:glycerophosphodiester phosphodiesterase family protein [Pyxidicoccus sp. 3LFB2]
MNLKVAVPVVVCLCLFGCGGVEAQAPEPSGGAEPGEALGSDTAALGWANGAIGKLRNKAKYPTDRDMRLCLDFEGSPAGAGALAQLYKCEGTNTDGDFKLIATVAPYYKLQARPGDGSNLCLGFASFASGQDGKLQACSASTVGEFEPFNPVTTDNAGYVQLRLRQNRALCLDVVGTPGTYNDYAQLYACGSTHVDGHWRFVSRSTADACTKGARAYDPYVRKAVTLPSPARTPNEQVPLVAFDVQGHRGARYKRPENSMAAFEYALAQGATTLELDLIESADGVLVVSHDNDIRAQCDPYKGWVGTTPAGHPLITSMTYSTLFDSYDCGYSVDGDFPRQESVCGEKLPRLENVIEFAEAWMDTHAHPKGLTEINYNIELKAKRPSGAWSAMARTMHDIVVAYGVQYRTTAQTFDANALTAAQAYPDWTPAQLSSSWNGTSAARVYSYEDSVWTTTPGHVDDAHNRGKLVMPWTTNSAADVQALYDLGVDGVITDNPAALDQFARVCARPASLPRNVFGKLKSQAREGLCLDFSGRPGLSGALGQTWACHDTDSDGDVRVLDASTGKVKLQSRSGSLYLRIDPQTTVLYSNAHLAPSTQGVLDEFTVVPVDTRRNPSTARSVYFQLRSTATDTGCAGGLVCLGAKNGPESGPNETVELRCCSKDSNMLWAFCPGL